MRTKYYTLPAGYVDETGQLHVEVELAELTGDVQVEISQAKYKSNPVVAVNVILQRAIKRLGALESKSLDLDILDRMPVGSRDFLLFHATRPWRSTEINGNCRCPGCKKPYTVPALLENFTKAVLPDVVDKLKQSPPALSSEDGECAVRVIEGVYADSKKPGVYLYDLKDANYEVDATFRLATGLDQQKVVKIAQDNPVEAGLVLLARTCMRWGQEKGVPSDFFVKLPSEVSEWITLRSYERTPGLEVDVSGQCPDNTCGFVQELAFSDFLLSSRRAKKTSNARSTK